MRSYLRISLFIFTLLCLQGKAIAQFSQPVTFDLSAANGGTANDMIQFAIASDATLGYDLNYDANKIMGTIIDLWLEPTPNLKLSVNYVPVPTGRILLPVFYKSMFQGQHTLRYSGGLNLTSYGINLTLLDSATGTRYPIASQGAITFSSPQANVAVNRFYLVYEGPTALTKSVTGQSVICRNPVHKGQKVPLSLAGVKRILLIDALGHSTEILVEDNAFFCPDLPAGIYRVKALDRSRLMATSKLMVQ